MTWSRCGRTGVCIHRRRTCQGSLLSISFTLGPRIRRIPPRAPTEIDKLIRVPLKTEKSASLPRLNRKARCYNSLMAVLCIFRCRPLLAPCVNMPCSGTVTHTVLLLQGPETTSTRLTVAWGTNALLLQILDSRPSPMTCTKSRLYRNSLDSLAHNLQTNTGSPRTALALL